MVTQQDDELIVVEFFALAPPSTAAPRNVQTPASVAQTIDSEQVAHASTLSSVKTMSLWRARRKRRLLRQDDLASLAKTTDMTSASHVGIFTYE